METEGISTKVNQLSARDVLENIGIKIYNQEIKKKNPYEQQLKGTLSRAQFVDALSRYINTIRYNEGTLCDFNYKFHTNITTDGGDGRHPCYGRQKNRFSESQEYGCSNVYIKGNENNSNGTACAPPRRRHICDQNLEFLDNDHTDDTDDLLGNVLVTAKYEGNYIVNDHPDKNSNGNKSGICTSLARSFADIGDIVRGRDMFKSNDNIEKGLRVVFKKIYEGFLDKGANVHYKEDKDENYYKLRNDWWTANRDQVWKAITCEAPKDANYFTKESDGRKLFTSQGYCGRNETDVPTNLDYVPQFLRWYDEWAEDFCRIRYHKLKRIKDACRNEKNGKYCSHNGYDCRQMSWKKNIESREHYCTGCFSACSIYNMWVDKQKKEFEKQKEKYKNEIETYASNKDKTGSKINEEYYKEFYEKLKNEYKDVHNFLTLLNEGRYCKEELQGEENVDFTNTNEKGASYRSKYCKVCPYCGVDCVGKTCTPKEEIYPNCENNETYDPPDGAETTEINVINSGDKEGYIFEKLGDFCMNPNNENGKNYEQWKCYYDNKKNNNKCKMEINIANSKLKNKITSFDFFFDLWIKNLLRDTINWKSELKNCINNKNTEKCNKECNENCKCFEKWVKQKEQEWKNVKKVFENKNGTSQNYYNKLKSHFDNYFFLVINNVNQGEEKWKKFTEELRKKMDFSKANTGTNDAQDSIKILLDHEKKNAGTCLENNPSEPCSKAEPQKSEEKNQPQDAPPNSCGAAGDKNGKTASVEQICKDVKRYITENNEKTKKQTNTGCNKKGNSKKWECEKNIDPKHAGACMPPRRQTLCIYYLSHDKEIDNIKTAEKLKDGVMKSAALETHFLWEKYKTDKNGGNSGKTLDDQLKEGNIPEDFKRQMFYTYGDYRDLFFGTDISNHRYIIEVKNNVNMALTQNVSEKTRNLNNIKNEWWQKHGPEIWMGMLCALTNGIDKKKEEKIKILEESQYKIPPEEFAEIPQFLRWMIEWSEHFCKEQKKKYTQLVAGCNGYECNGENDKVIKKRECVTACKAYKKLIDDWRPQWNTQSNKYKTLYAKATNGIGSDSIETHLLEYLKKRKGQKDNSDIYSTAGGYMEKEGYIEECQEQNNFSKDDKDNKYPFKDYPYNHEYKCNCKVHVSPPEVRKVPIVLEVKPPQNNECTIVENLFHNQNPINFEDACRKKYGSGQYVGWKCDSDVSKPEKNDVGAVCIPPRTQKLYIKKLKELDGENKEALRKAFIECAAVETFFAWHKFKMDRKPPPKDDASGLNPFIAGALVQEQEDLSQDKKAQEDLERGTIPEEFLREMFYTFGDYRDIFFGKDVGNGTNVGKDNDTTRISENITKILNGASKAPSGETNNQREEWWKEYGKDIWDGMVCALSYNTNDKTLIPDVRGKLTKKEDYKYEKVTINSIPISKDKSATTTVSLSEFASRPTFFRWLEEWGDGFCRKRTDRLAQLKEECQGININGYQRYCSGDGYDCTDENLKHNNIYANLDCRGCEKECRNYKKWIENKKNEFDKHKNKYKNKINNVESKSINIYDKTFYNNLKNNYSSVENFLASLNHCKHRQDNSDPKKNTDFNNNETFSPSTYCKVCPLYGVNCRRRDGCKVNNENKQTYPGVSTVIPVLINDGATKDTDNDLEKYCTTCRLYKDLRKQEWKCQHINKIYKCELQKHVNSGYYDDKIPFNILFQRWIKDFIQYYNKSKSKISLCIKNQDARDNICIEGCKGKLECVEKWLEKKENEWGKIKQYYKEQQNPYEHDVAYTVKSIFEQQPFDSYAEEAKKVVDNPCDREKLWGCTGDTQCKNDEEEKEHGDFITNLISKLQEKIGECKSQHNGNDCTTPPTSLEDDEEPYEDLLLQETEENEKTNIQPGFCPPPTQPPPEPADEDTCTSEPRTPKEAPMSCVERAAKKLRQEAEDNAKTYDTKLKGDAIKFNGGCNKVKKENGAAREHLCNFEKTYKNSVNKINNKCNDNRKERFKIGQKWNSKYISKIGKDLYIPPRREHMCINHLKEIFKHTATDSSTLLKIIQEAVQHEGDDIIRKLLEQNSCDEHRICDAMKYSFADLADIIRGTDIWKGNREQQKIQERLVKIFRNIYDNLEKDEYEKYKYGTKYQNLRSAWWDAHRKKIWNAMTCSAPGDFLFVKRGKGDGSDIEFLTFSEHKKCGHDKEPPVYDYVPQILRWITEWSEHFCELQEKNYYLLKEKCADYIQKDSKPIDDSHNIKCNTCKTKCEEYSKFIKKWNSQYINLEKKFKELYDEANNTKSYEELYRIGKPSHRNHYEDENLIQFLQNVKSECNEPNTVDKYLMYTSDCRRVKFSNTIDTNVNKPTADVTHNTINGPSSNLPVVTETNIKNELREYAFLETPEGYGNACKCKGPEPLDRCPENDNISNYCNDFVSVPECTAKIYKDEIDHWNNANVKFKTSINNGVLVPPRRSHICLKNMITKNYDKKKNGMEKFKTDLLQVAYNEGYFLCQKYDKQPRDVLEAMKYTFADIADIVKGRDMINKDISAKLRKLLDIKVEPKAPRKWWKYNKAHVWHAMLCGYRKGGGTITNDECNVPDEEYTYQFLRWFQEWIKKFCTGQQKLYDDVQTKCSSANCNRDDGTISLPECESSCVQYKNYITRKRQEYRSLNHQYNMNFKEQKAQGMKATQYIDDKCNSKCDCLIKYIDREKEWTNIYDSLENNDLKNKCDCKQIKPKRHPKEVNPEEEPANSEPDYIVPLVPQKPSTPEVPPPPPPPLPTPSDEPFNRDILEKTIPFGIALALCSIAFLFIKKKPKSSVDLLRVIDIHKGDYDIPTLKSKNRYIPYKSAQYKGKTYIYMEGDSDSGHYYEDTTDITSSESEYEEMDINDIYVPGSPKYKTLIEVVLEPSKRDTQNDIPSDNTPSYKLTDEEWNQLKHDFISQYLPNTEPNNNYRSGNSPTNTNNTTTSHDNMGEKPFITSIHDRDLYTGEEISYNINMSTNTNNDIPKYVSNNVYSGIDLINDTLSGNKHIDIYDEVLKRKENELFGTNHPKNTSNNSVAKLTNSDPIMNQLDLLHKWLDRHRDMCDKWNTKEELLDKLNEQWNKDNDVGGDISTSNGNKTLNTNVSIEIDMDETKGKKEFSNMDTILDNIEDDIYYDVNDENPSMDDIPMDHNKVDVPKKVHVEMKILNNTFNGSLEPEFPISDVWNI
ncbi:hypothetical protein PFDG_00175 [Plasmodium falciparum Dd2]|uniref:Erythrocyte membrane protein 1 n=3 Tax=Plasmodium falciparum TaxID=5833 RepID=A0A0L7LW88_PLAF4|nr:hypothetical protein PFDG_00175 [Plasmodium falciparum Dd2]